VKERAEERAEVTVKELSEYLGRWGGAFRLGLSYGRKV
jgi:hypothetical protein